MADRLMGVDPWDTSRFTRTPSPVQTAAPSSYGGSMTTTPGTSTQYDPFGERNAFNWAPTSSRSTPGSQTYTGGGGTFTRGMPSNVGEIDPMTGRRIEAPIGMGGTWTSGAGGPQISDMPGYLGMREQQRAGADTSMYGSRLKDLMSDPSKITQTPAYQFNVGQGTQAINRSAAAKGQLGGGGVLAELQKYGAGMASQEYDKEIARLSSLMGQAQQFGAGTGYYNPEQYTPTLGIKSQGGGGRVTVGNMTPQSPVDYNSPMGYV